MGKGSLHQRSLGNATCQGRGAWAGRLMGQLGLTSAGCPVSCWMMGMIVAPTYRVKAPRVNTHKAPTPEPDSRLDRAGRIYLPGSQFSSGEPRTGSGGRQGPVFHPCLGLRTAPSTTSFFADWHISLPWDIFTEPSGATAGLRNASPKEHSGLVNTKAGPSDGHFRATTRSLGQL